MGDERRSGAWLVLLHTLQGQGLAFPQVPTRKQDQVDVLDAHYPPEEMPLSDEDRGALEGVPPACHG